MAKQKHTPGPWFIPCSSWAASGGVEGGSVEASRPTGRFLQAEDGTFYPEPPSYGAKICSYYTSGLAKGEGRANAVLIAAAPDLLDALQLVERSVTCGPEIDALIETVIAKATRQ